MTGIPNFNFSNSLWLTTDLVFYKLDIDQKLFIPFISSSQENLPRENLSLGSDNPPILQTVDIKENNYSSLQNSYNTLFIPGQWISCLQILLPAQLSRQTKETVIYAIEEQLVEDISQIHCKFIKDEDGKTFIYVIKQAHIAQINALLNTYQLEIDNIYPDFLSIPWEGVPVLGLFSNYAMLRNSLHEGFTFSFHNNEDLNKQLELLYSLDNFKKPAKCYFLNDIIQQDIVPINSQTSYIENIEQINENFVNNQKSYINLGQRTYRGFSFVKNNSWSLYALILSFSVFFFFIISNTILIKHYHDKISVLNQEINQLTTKLFPNDEENFDPVLMVKKAIKNQNNDTDKGFLYILAKVQSILKTYLINKNIEINSISYNNKQLTLAITSQSIQSIQNFLSELTKRNIRFQQQELKEENKLIQAKIMFLGE